MNAALSVVPATEYDEIDELEVAVEVGLTDAVKSLTRLRELSAHRQRGYVLWHAYLTDRFGDLLRLLRLPDGERLALVESMCTKTAEHPKGMPVRAQAELIGVSNGTVQNDKRMLGLAPPASVKPARRDPIGHLHKTDQIVILVGKAGEEGLTCFEAEEERGWRHGAASGAWTPVAKQGRIVKTDRKRLGYAVYVLGEG